MSVSSEESRIKQIAELEAARCEAISARDVKGLDDLLHENFVYGFLSGRLEDRATYMAGFPNHRHAVKSRILDVRIYGTVAVMLTTLEAINAVSGESAYEANALGVWVETGPGWKIVAYHTTKTSA